MKIDFMQFDCDLSDSNDDVQWTLTEMEQNKNECYD